MITTSAHRTRNTIIRTRKIRGEDSFSGSRSCAMGQRPALVQGRLILPAIYDIGDAKGKSRAAAKIIVALGNSDPAPPATGSTRRRRLARGDSGFPDAAAQHGRSRAKPSSARKGERSSSKT